MEMIQLAIKKTKQLYSENLLLVISCLVLIIFGTLLICLGVGVSFGDLIKIDKQFANGRTIIFYLGLILLIPAYLLLLYIIAYLLLLYIINKNTRRPNPYVQESYYDKIYNLSEAIYFYDAVSSYYDDRTSKQRESVNNLVYSICQSYFNDLKEKTICDIGGGTGTLLKKFKHHKVYWTNIDICDNALKIFEKKYRRHDKIETRHFDIRFNSFNTSNDNFDIIIISFVLSSIEENLSFNQISSTLKPNGILVIADNVPEYAKGKLYGYNDIDGKNIALKTKTINELALKSQVENSGFEQIDLQFAYTEANSLYAQVQVFKRKEETPKN